MMKNLTPLEKFFSDIWPHLPERQRRLVAAAEAKKQGYGGISAVSRACGLSRVTITKAIKELDETPFQPNRLRKPGGGRPTLEKCDPSLLSALDVLLDDAISGDPQRPLLWTCKSARTIAKELTRQGRSIGSNKVGRILKSKGYSLQANRYAEENEGHLDKNAQFNFISSRVKFHLSLNYPIIAVATKKKELTENCSDKGAQRKKNPVKLNGHDLPGASASRAFPYGIHDIAQNAGFVDIATDQDAAEFAAASIRGWWFNDGRHKYPKAYKILTTIDGGGSNGSRLELWTFELQKLADELKIPIEVCHFPPGTSKWNQINHRLFAFTSSNRRGEPSADYETVVDLISAVNASEELTVSCRLDRTKHKKKIKISDEELKSLNLNRSILHGNLNYTILPRV
ncbi:MAG: ISAzo13 family transposase [Deltaproteobacteria bacterium]|jgi:hypothetical protein|nr:ISAzo13 family transposase [Deltaproteobacteria bacterium]